MSRLKRARVRQADIARRLHINQATVSKVIARMIRGTETAEAVWREIERALRRVA